MAEVELRGITVEIGGDTTKSECLKGCQFRNQEYAESASRMSRSS